MIPGGVRVSFCAPKAPGQIATFWLNKKETKKKNKRSHYAVQTIRDRAAERSEAPGQEGSVIDM